MAYADRSKQEAFLKGRGKKYLYAKGGVPVPLAQVPRKQLYAVFMKEVEIVRKEANKVSRVCRDKQHEFCF